MSKKNIGFTLKKYREHNGIAVKDVAEKLNKSIKTIYAWENGNGQPDVETLIELCRMYKIYDFEVFSDTPLSHKNKFNISIEDKELLQSYNSLDSHGKEVVDGVLIIETKRMQEKAAQLAELEKEKQAKKNISNASKHKYTITAYDIPVSAGTGVTFDESQSFQMELDSPPPRGAAYAVPIIGDSMEPKYHEGDYVFVSPVYPEMGQVGIFYHDGSSYIKKLGQGELISINPKYHPIPMDDTTHPQGRVIGIYKPKKQK